MKLLETPKIDLAYKPRTDILKRIDEATKKKQPLLFINDSPLITVTQDMAIDMLSRNLRNRGQYQRRKDAYATGMGQDKWKYNADTIRFDWDGLLLDGQHRLEAIAQSGVSQVYIIALSLDPEVMSTIDRNKSRDTSDWLAIRGYKNSKVLSAAIKLTILFKLKRTVSGRIVSELIDDAEVDRFLLNGAREKLMVEAVEFAVEKYKTMQFLSVSQWAMLHFITLEANKEKGEKFMHMLYTGSDVSERRHTPIYYLRYELLQYLSTGKVKGGFRVNKVDILLRKFKLIIKAWNAFVSERKMDGLSLTKTEEQLPVVERMIDAKEYKEYKEKAA